MKNKNKTMKGGKTSRFYLDPLAKLAGTSNTWSSIFVPPFDDDLNLKKCIVDIYEKMQNKRVFTRCKFDDKIKKRITQIMFYTQGKNADKMVLSHYLMEMQLYLLVCRNQITNRAALVDLGGKLI
jgi:hypothetical protein